MALSFSHAVLQWARSKPANEAYDYCETGECAIAQFLRDTGRAAEPYVTNTYWMNGCGEPHLLDGRVAMAAMGSRRTDWTFGAFAERLQVALS